MVQIYLIEIKIFWNKKYANNENSNNLFTIINNKYKNKYCDYLFDNSQVIEYLMSQINFFNMLVKWICKVLFKLNEIIIMIVIDTKFKFIYLSLYYYYNLLLDKKWEYFIILNF